MNNLLKIKEYLSRYQEDAKAIRSEYETTLEEINRKFMKEYQTEQRQKATQDFEQKTAKNRKYYIDLIEKESRKLQQREMEYDLSHVDFELLNKLNTLAQAGIPLSKEVCIALICECVKSGSQICTDKMKSLLIKSNFGEVSFPDPFRAGEIINQTSQKAIEVINQYDGNDSFTGNDSTNRIYAIHQISGRWIESENERYRQITTADLSKIQRDADYKQAIEKKMNLEEVKESSGYGGQYAKEYSEKMNPTTKKDEWIAPLNF